MDDALLPTIRQTPHFAGLKDDQLDQTIKGVQALFCKLTKLLKPAEWEHLSAAEREAMDGLEKTSPPDSLARSEREEALTRWLDGNGVAEGWRLSPNFVSAGLDAAWLSALNGAGANDRVLVLEAIAT